MSSDIKWRLVKSPPSVNTAGSPPPLTPGNKWSCINERGDLIFLFSHIQVSQLLGPKVIHIARIREVQCETYNAKYPNPHEAKAPFAGPCERGQGPGRKKEEEKEEELPQPGGRRVSATQGEREEETDVDVDGDDEDDDGVGEARSPSFSTHIGTVLCADCVVHVSRAGAVLFLTN